jgi:formylglycine-generating enzyme required for sulfatase activity
MLAVRCPHCLHCWDAPDGADPDALTCPVCARPAGAAETGQRNFSLHVSTGGTAGATAAGAAEDTKREPAERPHPYLSPPELPDELGRLGGFRVLRLLGQGGMGAVFEAEDVGLQRRVALKVMLPQAAAHPQGRTRFLREARAAAALSHDHIVAIHHVGEDNAVPFYVMPLLRGESLERRLKRERPLPLAEAVRIAREMAEGLAEAHAAGLVHRDVKPANVWLEGSRARVKLLDFGVARPLADDARLTSTGTLVGTPAYMAPEQASGKAAPPSDLFSLGCVLYEMLTGQRPFRGETWLEVLASLLRDTPASPAEHRPEVPPALAALVLELIDKEPEGRPATAEDVAARLAELTAPPTATVVRAQAVPTALRVEPPVAPPRRRRWPLPVALASAAALAALALAVFWPRARPARDDGGDKPTDVPPPAPFVNGVGMKMIGLAPGRFTMGSPADENGRDDEEGPAHTVEIGRAFYLGETEVTVGQFRRFVEATKYVTEAEREGQEGEGYDTVRRKMARAAGFTWKNTGWKQSDDHPVVNVTWNDAVAFCKWLSETEGREYRLPTEAEWEYACRAGTASRFSFGDDEKGLPRHGNAADAAAQRALPGLEHALAGDDGHAFTAPVKSFAPNGRGLYDMHGNVSEWCADGPRTYQADLVRDPVGPSQGTQARRGGSWAEGAAACRSAARDANKPAYRSADVGFRVACLARAGE